MTLEIASSWITRSASINNEQNYSVCENWPGLTNSPTILKSRDGIYMANIQTLLLNVQLPICAFVNLMQLTQMSFLIKFSPLSEHVYESAWSYTQKFPKSMMENLCITKTLVLLAQSVLFT